MRDIFYIFSLSGNTIEFFFVYWDIASVISSQENQHNSFFPGMLGINFRVFYILDKQSTTGIHLQLHKHTKNVDIY